MAKEVELIKYEQEVAIALGLVDGLSIVNKFGQNTDIDTTTDPEDIWSAGGLYSYQTTAQALEIVSTSTEDDPTGTGAFTVEIQGLGADWNMQTEIITMDGTTAVDLANTYLRVFRAIVLTSGTNNTNVGTITIQLDGGGVAQALIVAGHGQTLMALYTVPANTTGYIRNLYSSLVRFTVAQETAVDMSLYVRPFGGSWNVKHTWGMKTDGSGSYVHDYFGGEEVTEKSDIRITVNQVQNDNTSISAGFDILLKSGV